jgi:hypothetical protein
MFRYWKPSLRPEDLTQRSQIVTFENGLKCPSFIKYSLLIVFSVLFFSNGFATLNKDAFVPGRPSARNNDNNAHPTVSKMRIKIGTNTFTATLYNNATATAFKSLLPMTVNMIELNENEKYFDLPVKLPTNASNPRTIQSGDLMIYGTNTLVLFYKTFSTSYSYTLLGRINDTAKLAAIVGSGNLTVTYELE